MTIHNLSVRPFSSCRTFFVLVAFFLLAGSGLSLICSQETIFLAVNRIHHPVADRVFLVLTHLGDGLFMFLTGCVLLLVRLRFAFLTFVCLLAGGLAAQCIKKLLAWPRPAKFFDGVEPLRIIPGYAVHWHNAFPSGHTTTVFSLALVLLYVLIRTGRTGQLWQYGLFVAALLVGYSRIYLSEHFFGDVLAGALLGAGLTGIVIWWMETSRWYHSGFMDRRLKMGKPAIRRDAGRHTGMALKIRLPKL